MNYDLVLFDIDGTLLDFDMTEKIALEDTCREYGFPYNEEMLNVYHQINVECWKQLEEGLINKEELAFIRFDRFFKKFNLKGEPIEFNTKYRSRLGEGAYLIKNAVEICKTLYGKVDLAVASNGGKDIQYNRLRKVDLEKYFKYLFISEEIGYNKPDIRFFETVFERANVISPERVLIIGDSISADIQGGNIAGIKTCWYNPKGIKDDKAIKKDFIIKDLMELEKIILG